MYVGIPRERFVDERRVAISPAGVREIVEMGADVYVEHNAGAAAGWQDEEYEKRGATIAYSAEEAICRADLLLKILPPTIEESQMMREDQTLMSYLQLPLARKEVFENLRDKSVIAIGLENIWYEGGGHPVRRAMSEIAGALAIHMAAQYLQAQEGGRGILMGGLPGVPPASVGIVGAGVVGGTAARSALDIGAHVIMVDQHVAPLRRATLHYGKRLQTAIINENNLEKLCKFVDVLICAVMVEDHRAPHIITREMVQSMKPRSVIIDASIDQGGVCETSRPTHISNPIYEEEGVIHYCVPNMPAMVPRTATRAFQNQVLPLIKSLVKQGVVDALRTHPYMHTGLNMFDGIVTRESVAESFGTEWTPPLEVLQ